MCVSASPFEGFTPPTILGGFMDDNRQLLVYENGAKPSGKQASNGNAMLLHTPTSVDDVEILPASADQLARLQQNLADIILPTFGYRYRSGMRGGGFSLPRNEQQTFEQGAYSIAIARPDRQFVNTALSRLAEASPDSTIPQISQEMLEFYQRLQEDANQELSLIIAVFDPRKKIEPHPIAVSFTSTGSLFLPGLERHDGQPPVLGDRGMRDFNVLCAEQVRFDQGVGFSFDPNKIAGFHERSEKGHNRDYTIPRSDLAKAVLRFSSDDPTKLTKIAAAIELFRASDPSGERRADWQQADGKLREADSPERHYSQEGDASDFSAIRASFARGYFKGVSFPNEIDGRPVPVHDDGVEVLNNLLDQL